LQRFDIVGLGKFDLVSGEESLQVLFGCLLAMEADDLPDSKIICGCGRQPARDFQIGVGFLDPRAAGIRSPD
jgi:hypothetical protein